MTTPGDIRIEVEARPGEFEFAPRTTGVVVVDMQHDFADPEGMFGRAGIPLDGIRGVVEPTRHVLDAAREMGMLVVYLVMQFDEDLSDLGSAAAPNRTRHLAPGRGRVDRCARRQPQPGARAWHLEHQDHRGALATGR